MRLEDFSRDFWINCCCSRSRCRLLPLGYSSLLSSPVVAAAIASASRPSTSLRFGSSRRCSSLSALVGRGRLVAGRSWCLADSSHLSMGLLICGRFFSLEQRQPQGILRRWGWALAGGTHWRLLFFLHSGAAASYCFVVGTQQSGEPKQSGSQSNNNNENNNTLDEITRAGSPGFPTWRRLMHCEVFQAHFVRRRRRRLSGPDDIITLLRAHHQTDNALEGF